jgi:Protein of unknown function DUF262/Protein of unknown function (DUF1524)
VQAATVEVLALFDRDIRYLVPIFQRNYRWTEDKHWAPLWADVRDVAEDLLDVDEGLEASDHFLGAIVCEQVPAYGRDAHAVQVIDGQQRLMTLQLLLAAVRSVAAKRGMPDADYVNGFIENKASVVRDRPEHRYKIWPNIADRETYPAAMGASAGPSGPQQAVQFFRRVIERWLDVGLEDDPLDDDDNTAQERMEALVTALTRSLKVVKIDLEANDNAQVIFETLNARGERLTDADLIRNHLFRMADEQKKDGLALHSQYWRPFEGKEWQAHIAHGRHQRDRLELFLNYWLSMRRSQEVPASAIFRAFKEHANGKSAEEIASDIAKSAKVFDSFDQQAPDTAEWWFFRRVAEMDLITVYPVLLWLLGQDPDELGQLEKRRALTAIESFLGRRLVGRYSTRSYGDVFIQLLKYASEGPVGEADRRIVGLLAEKSAEADRWPSDDEFRSVVLNTNVYRLKASRLKMVLEAIDRQMASGGRSETVTLGHNLWIEHLLPQTWRGSSGWSLPADLEDLAEVSAQRDHLLHTLGNLTLTTSKLDIELSNKPWPEKLVQIGNASSLALNRDVTTRYADNWDETTIRNRGGRLADVLIEVWPGPDRLLT